MTTKINEMYVSTNKPTRIVWPRKICKDTFRYSCSVAHETCTRTRVQFFWNIQYRTESVKRKSTLIFVFCLEYVSFASKIRYGRELPSRRAKLRLVDSSLFNNCTCLTMHSDALWCEFAIINTNLSYRITRRTSASYSETKIHRMRET